MSPLTKDVVDDMSLWDICQIGAEAQRKNPDVIPRCYIMPCEVEKVRSHMKAHYPEIRYQLNYPVGAPTP